MKLQTSDNCNNTYKAANEPKTMPLTQIQKAHQDESL